MPRETERKISKMRHEVKFNEKQVKKQCEDILKKKSYRYNFVNFGTIPYLYHELGFGKRDMLYTKQHLVNALGREHKVSVTQISKLGTKMESPILIIDSDFKHERTAVVVTDMVDVSCAPIIMAIKRNAQINDIKNVPIRDEFKTLGKSKDGRDCIIAHMVLSVYGKDNDFEGYVNRALAEGRIRYVDKEKLGRLSSLLRLHLAEGFDNLPDKTIIRHFDSTVKSNGKEASGKTI